MSSSLQEPAINSLLQLMSLTSVSRPNEIINISSGTTSRLSSGISQISTSLRVPCTNIDSTHGCRRSARQSNIAIRNCIDESIIGTGDDDSPSTSNRNTTNSSETTNQHTPPNLSNPVTPDFFTTHEDRDVENEPELNTGIIDVDEEEIDIGWGGQNDIDNNNGIETDDGDVDLTIDPFATNNNVTIAELNAALGNLTLDQEINGHSNQLPDYINSDLPERSPEEMIGVNKNIKKYVTAIKNHQKRANISSSEHMNYIEILVEMNRANAPQSLFDTVSKLIQKNFYPNSNSAPPTRLTMLSWIEKQVHPEELRHLSLPRTTPINDCPSGRSVAITSFDSDYQLALLLSNEEIMDPKNLLFPNLDDPCELLPVDGPLEDVNSGYFHQKMTRARCIRQNDLLFPFVDFCDGTNVSRNSLEPYLRCPGILNRKTRNKPESWFALGFFEPMVNFSPLLPGQKYESTDKLNDYHHILKFLMKDSVRLEQSGFEFDLDLGRGKIHEVAFWPVTQVVLGDCKGADILCGRFGSHRGTKGVCRDCDCPSTEASSSTHQCNFLDKFTMKMKTNQELKDMSFWKLPRNAFNYVNSHIPDVWGIFGLTPPEILHLFYIGLCVYLCQGFIFQRSGAMRKYLDASAISLYTHNKRQSLRGMPSLAAYRNGFVMDVGMTTGKEKFSKVFLLYLFLMKADIVE